MAENAQHAIAMHGGPKYKPGFTHFDYANPGAPQGGTLRLGVVGTFDSLNPFIVRGQTSAGPGFALSNVVYESLMARSWDEPFSLYGLIAESVEVPEDRSWVIFNLRFEARWQDGEAITADDVLFSHKTLRDQGRPNHRTYYKKVEKAEKLGERRVRFAFKRNEDGSIDREMPLIMGLMPILPEHVWKGQNFNQTTLKLPVGSGPYKVAKVEPGRSVTYERDLNYWGRDVPAQRGLYNFAVVRFDYYRDDNIALQAFKAGQFDLRREVNPNKWATGYEGPALQDGRIIKTAFAHERPEPISGFVLNTRRPLLQDSVLREALGAAFDFGWINKSLFRGLYKRSASYFPNSELASARPQEGGDEEAFRSDLLKAAKELRGAGYELRGDELFTPDGKPVVFEILLSDPTEEKIALEWARALKRLGIVARARTVDSSQYQARLTGFDYDVVTAKWYNSLSPGNEQIAYWGSAAAKQQGSRNYPGVSDPSIDALAAAIPAARTREELVGATQALDRALLAGHYIVPFYYVGADWVAYWKARIGKPDVTPTYGPIFETWWAGKEKN